MKVALRERVGRWAATVLITGIAVAFGASAAGAIGVPQLPQILPIPQVGPLSPSGHKPPPGTKPRPLPNCPSFRRVKLPLAKSWLRRVRVGHVADGFRANMFGIAAGGVIQARSCAALAKELNDDAQVHARWLRFDINWAVIQNDGPSQYDWARFDRVVKEASARGMRVLGDITYTPWWARPGGTYAVYGPDPSTYARFAGVAARHYSQLGVHAFEIWNEPNTIAFWQPAPNPAAYTAVLKAAYVAIKRADPHATVLTAGTAPGATVAPNYSPIDFLKGIYAAGGRSYFNAVGDHPYSWPIFPGVELPSSAWYQMYGTNPSLRSVMIANGDGGKKIWATEFGAPTDGLAGTFVSPADQAKMVISAYRLFASYRWAGPLFFFEGRDFGTDPATNQDFFGLTRYDFSPKPAYTAYLAVSNAVSRATAHHRRSRKTTAR